MIYSGLQIAIVCICANDIYRYVQVSTLKLNICIYIYMLVYVLVLQELCVLQMLYFDV